MFTKEIMSIRIFVFLDRLWAEDVSPFFDDNIFFWNKTQACEWKTHI